jgi:hypothetical protein
VNPKDRRRVGEFAARAARGAQHFQQLGGEVVVLGGRRQSGF